MMNDKYPRNAADFADLGKCVDNFVLDGLTTANLIGPTTRVLTQGSCFATNVFTALNSLGVNVDHMKVPESSNSPVGNAQGLLVINAAGIEMLRQTDVFIFTLGVSLAAVSPTEWRFCSVEENVQALSDIVGHLRKINPAVNIVMSLSPVPLNRAVGLGMSPVLADCLSKSTLRVAIDRFMASNPERVYYWPSFEIVRWLGAHTGPAYGDDDGQCRHVNAAIVDVIMAKFLKHFSTLAPNAGQ